MDPQKLKSYFLPNGGGTYSAMGGGIVTPQNFVPKPVAPQNPIAPIVPSSNATPPIPVKPSKYINPATGAYYTPEEYANSVAQKIPVSKATGDVGQYAGDAIAKPDQTSADLTTTARGLNNARNDIAVGEKDPYKVGKDSGIAYSPAQLTAIEKAYAGIYDPALQDVFTKLEAKQKEDAAATATKQKLAEMAQQHIYDMELKRAPSGDKAPGSDSSVYVPGADPVVDGWVDKINRTGDALEKAIPGVANQALRNKVMMGLNAKKYDTAAIAGTLNDINNINTLLSNPELSSIVGPIDQYTGGIWGEAKTARVMFDQLSGALQLAKAGSIKGQGQISDYERTVLKQAAIALERGQSEEEFRKSMIKIRGVMMTASGLAAPVKITDPTTGESDMQSLNTEEIKGFIKDGAIIEYI